MEIVPNGFSSFMLREMDDRSEPLDILDVGGGSASRVPFDDARITVIDNSADALARNPRADEKLVGDAQTYDYGDRRFDVAVFWNVLEHVPEPEAAVERACDNLKPDGVVVVRGPELGSLKSIITRLTPHWVHILYYRWVLRIRDAGTAGRPPCRVEHSDGADRSALIDVFRRRGFSVRYEQRYIGDQVTELRRFSRLAYGIYAAAAGLLRLLTFSRYGEPETEFILVARKPRPA